MNIIYDFSDRRFGDMQRRSNLKRFISSLDGGFGDYVRARQVHGNGIAEVGERDIGRVIPEADGLITTEEKTLLAVLGADCLPMLFYDPARGIIGAAHAGWRGTAVRISEGMVERFARLGSRPSDIRVIFGPSICSQHYEVGDDVVSVFLDHSDYPGGGLKELPRGEFVKKRGRVFLDLRETNRRQLLGVGVLEGNIDIDPRCTFEDPRLYSYRREQPNLSGLFAGVIGMN